MDKVEAKMLEDIEKLCGDFLTINQFKPAPRTREQQIRTAWLDAEVANDRELADLLLAELGRYKRNPELQGTAEERFDKILSELPSDKPDYIDVPRSPEPPTGPQGPCGPSSN